MTAVNEVRSCNVTLVDDTDLLVLLFHHAPVSTEYKLHCRSDRSLPVGQRNVIHDIYAYKNCIGTELCLSLLAFHSMIGCDTSSFYGIGKGTACTKFLKNSKMKESLKTLSSSEIPNETIISTGEEIIEEICEGKNDETIQEMRIRYFMEKFTKGKSFIKPERLPPTKVALK